MRNLFLLITALISLTGCFDTVRVNDIVQAVDQNGSLSRNKSGDISLQVPEHLVDKIYKGIYAINSTRVFASDGNTIYAFDLSGKYLPDENLYRDEIGLKTNAPELLEKDHIWKIEATDDAVYLLVSRMWNFVSNTRWLVRVDIETGYQTKRMLSDSLNASAGLRTDPTHVVSFAVDEKYVYVRYGMTYNLRKEWDANGGNKLRLLDPLTLHDISDEPLVLQLSKPLEFTPHVHPDGHKMPTSWDHIKIVDEERWKYAPSKTPENVGLPHQDIAILLGGSISIDSGMIWVECSSQSGNVHPDECYQDMTKYIVRYDMNGNYIDTVSIDYSMVLGYCGTNDDWYHVHNLIVVNGGIFTVSSESHILRNYR